MYSVVLMMAITTGGDVPDCHRGGECGGGGLLSRRHSCGGGCYGGGCYGGGCYGGACYGGACYGGAYYGCGGGVYMPPMKEEIKKMPDKKEEKKEETKEKIGVLGAPGRIVVSMPADARFSVDDYTSPAQSDTHIVVSAPLGSEETRTYVLKAEVVRDGKVRTMEQRVTVRSGEEAKVTLSLPASVASR